MSSFSSSSARLFYDYCKEHSIPFGYYRLPVADGQDMPMAVAQKDGVVSSLEKGEAYSGKRGFVFAPFQEIHNFKKVLIRPDIYTPLSALPDLDFAQASALPTPEPNHYRRKMRPSTEEEYTAYISRIKMNIWQGRFQKVVAARAIEARRPEDFHPSDMFKKLCADYPHAFISLVHVPEYGTWIGATPELLLEVKNKTFTTQSIAGTMLVNPARKHSDWDDKEIHEQSIVSHYIEDTYQKMTGRKPEILEHGNIQAGNVMHLQTKYQLKDAPISEWQTLAEELHPTPAVAGIPKDKTISFILKTETTDREFYSGYLGPVNLDDSVRLFVNLRCMKVMPRKLILYVGAGITVNSRAKDEWKETNFKAQTLLRVIERMYPKAELF